MTTPVLQSKTWQYAINSSVRTPASVADAIAYQLWYNAAFLLGNIAVTDFDNAAIAGGSVQGKWTIYTSCDGTTAGTTGDGVDYLNLGGAYDLTKWVRATAGNPHSWVVLKSPVGMGPWYICLNHASGTAHQAEYVMSKNVFTGGTTTARPTAVNEAATPTNRQLTHASTITQGRMRATLCTDGNFIIQHSIDGTGYFDYFFAGCTLAETLGADEQHNFWILNDYEISSPGAPHMQNWQAFGTAAITGRGPLGTVLTGGACIEQPYAGGAAVYAGALAGRDQTNNKFRNRQVVVVTSTPDSERGVLVDMSLCAQGTSAWLNGDFVPDTGTGQFREFMRSGHMLLPGNGVAHTL